MRIILCSLLLIAAAYAEDAGSGNSGLDVDVDVDADVIGANSLDFALQYEVGGQVKRYETNDFNFPDITGLTFPNGSVITEPFTASFSFANGGDFDWKELYANEYIKHIFSWRIIPTFIFGIIMLLVCQLYNCCNCRAIHAEGDNDAAEDKRCCKCCTPPDAANTNKMCRTFFYVLLIGSAVIAVFLGSYGLAESERQGQSGAALVEKVDSMAVWATEASADVLSTAGKAVKLFESAEDITNSAACTDAAKDLIEQLKNEIGSFESFLAGGIDGSSFEIPDGIDIPDISSFNIAELTPEQIAAAEAAAAGAGGGRRRRALLEDNANPDAAGAVNELNGMVQSVEGQIQMIQNFTSDIVLKYEDKRAQYVKIGLGIVVGLVVFTILIGLLAACTEFMKKSCCACLMGGWSALMILIMFLMFILAGVLLIIITLWADFCADNFGAMLSILSKKDFVYDTVEYYSYCPTYSDERRASDFPFNEFIDPAKQALDLAGSTLDAISSTVAGLDNAACTAEVETLNTEYQDIYTDAFSSTAPYGLFTADGPVGCGALNEHLNSVMTLTCNDLYNPLSRCFEFFFVIGWLILFSELATKCLKVGNEVAIDKYIEG